MDEMMDKELKGHPKRTHYLNIWNNQRVQMEKEKYEFTLLAKPMEKFIAGNPRPRLVFSPNPFTLIFGVLHNKVILKALKYVLPEITAGMSAEDLAYSISLGKFDKSYSTLCVDGSSHDSNQHS